MGRFIYWYSWLSGLRISVLDKLLVASLETHRTRWCGMCGTVRGLPRIRVKNFYICYDEFVFGKHDETYRGGPLVLLEVKQLELVGLIHLQIK